MGSKVKAFTLFELVLSMLLATIVIGMAYYASSIFMRLQEGYSKTNLVQAELVQFKKVMAKDVERAASLELSEGELLLEDLKGGLLISYELGKDRVLRKAILLDTFKLKDLKVQGSFEGQVQESGLADLLVFSFSHADEPALFQVKKQYSAEELFQLKK
ncbi:hypothetical protein HDC92_004646 [Pedobacter sp. AK017]|uniref:PulJ/GspJ family protein n=1 Tax=Pedobacter sp. AK017 TaxID=2723073 RepID=UPI00160E6792|nr:hypothetical protein [Pedobacter sp. AK017]MBB5440942.1 hypothetical protein [Pedobacter sp. AK017]